MKSKLLLTVFLFLSIQAISQFGFKTTIYSTKPISAKMSWEKDGVKARDIYIVSYDVENESGQNSKKRVGYICVDKVGRENSEISSGNSSVTTFKKIGAGKLENGMNIEKMKSNFLSYAFEYPISNGSIFSGPNLNFVLRIGYSKLILFTGYYNKVSTKTSVTWNSVTKKYEIDGLNMGLKFEQAIPLNYLELSPVFGFSGNVPFVPLVGEISNPLDPRYTKTGSVSGVIVHFFGGLKLGLNVSPRLQLYVQDLYSFNAFETWEAESSGVSQTTLSDQFKGNMNFRANSINVGIRIR